MKRRPPRRRPAAAAWSLPAALVLAALAVLLGQHFAAGQGWISGDSWLGAAAEAAAEPRPSTWVLAAGIGAAALGLLMLIAALLPARRSHRPVTGDCDLWVSAGALAAMAEDAADRSPGVMSSRADVGRRIRVEAVVQTGGDSDSAAIRDAVAERLAGLTDLDVTVNVKERDR